MFKSQAQFTNSMFGAYSYNPILERNQDHLLIKMNKLIDWSFVEEEVADCYSEKGQRAIHPVRIFKLLIAQALYNLSERDVCEQADCNIIFRYFVGLGLNDDIPHWTDLGKFKERIGMKNFEKLFYRVLGEAERLGITISKKDRAKKEKNKHYIHLRKLRYKVEPKFAEAKNRHGLGKTRYKGIWKTHLGCLIIYMAINLKRIVNLRSLQTA